MYLDGHKDAIVTSLTGTQYLGCIINDNYTIVGELVSLFDVLYT